MEPITREMLSQEFDLFVNKIGIVLPTDKLASFFIEKGMKMILDGNTKEVAVNKIRLATESGYSWGIQENEKQVDNKKRKVDSEEKEEAVHE